MQLPVAKSKSNSPSLNSHMPCHDSKPRATNLQGRWLLTVPCSTPTLQKQDGGGLQDMGQRHWDGHCALVRAQRPKQIWVPFETVPFSPLPRYLPDPVVNSARRKLTVGTEWIICQLSSWSRPTVGWVGARVRKGVRWCRAQSDPEFR